MDASLRRFLPNELLIGLPEVDAQHEAVFARLVHLKQVCLEKGHLPPEEADQLLRLLGEHYVTEGRIAAELGIDFSGHIQQHQVMQRAVTKTLNEAVAGRTKVFSLLRYLEYWFERHIAEEDMILGQRPQGGASPERRAETAAIEPLAEAIVG